jgi:hypothetical protein
VDPAHLSQAALPDLLGAVAAMEVEGHGTVELAIPDHGIYQLVPPDHASMDVRIEPIGEIRFLSISATDVVIYHDADRPPTI